MTLRSDSERWFVACWPAIVTLLLGWFLFLNAASKERTVLNRRIENQGSIADQRKLLVLAKEELAAVHQEQARLREEISNQRLSFDRGLAMRRISVLCEELDLQISQTKADTSANLLPIALKNSIAKQPAPSDAAPQVWCVELSGSYSSVLKLLKGIASTSPLMVPLNLTMETDPKERLQPSWKLYVWL